MLNWKHGENNKSACRERYHCTTTVVEASATMENFSNKQKCLKADGSTRKMVSKPLRDFYCKLKPGLNYHQK